MNVVEQFVAALPAGEWTNIRVLNGAELHGLMASKNWAILAEATALRHGGREAFLKCIVAAGEGAGQRTQAIIGRERLERVRQRLESIRSRATNVPLVEILECRFLSEFEGLLVAMERVTTLNRLIESSNAGVPLALQVLAQLGPSRDGEWHHFDVCPRNVGRTNAGRLVYIDVESLYVADAVALDVSTPIGKWHRLPVRLNNAIIQALATNKNRIDVTLGMRKQAFDLAFLAAECSLVALPPFERSGITENWVNEIVSHNRGDHEALARFWADHLRPAVIGDQQLDLGAIAQALNDFVDAQKHYPPPSPPSPPSAASPQQEASTGPARAPIPAGAVTDFDREWEAMQTTAGALRRDALGRAEVDSYRERLEVLARKYPDRAIVWDELVSVLISYQRDRHGALRVAQEALGHHPANRELQRMQQIIAMWATGDQ